MPHKSTPEDFTLQASTPASDAQAATVRWVTTRPIPQGAADARELFHHTFHTQPHGVWSAPGRVNLIGEHVDYAGGISLPFALSQRTFVAMAPNGTAHYRLVTHCGEPSQTMQETVATTQVRPGYPANWTGYVVGTIWAARANGCLPQLPEGQDGYDIAIVSDVPVGGGLSSSAALECSTALAAWELSTARTNTSVAAPIEPSDDVLTGLMNASITAENEVVGASTGGLDQRIALFAKAGYALAIDFARNTTEHIPFNIAAEGKTILIINTNAPHSLADGQYASRRAVIDGVTEYLGVTSLREAPDAQKHSAGWARTHVPKDAEPQEWEATVARRVRHVMTEIERTAHAIELIRAGDLVGFGKAMQASHASLRDDYEVTIPELDTAVEIAMNHGALGARMTGGGFGGSAIALIDTAKAPETAQAITQAFAKHGFNQPEFLLAVPSHGAERFTPQHTA